MSELKEQITKIADADSTNIKASVSQRGAKGAQSVEIVDASGNQINLASGLVPESYDYLALAYTGDDLTSVIYKTGGASGTTVATLTLTYTSSVLQTITRT